MTILFPLAIACSILSGLTVVVVSSITVLPGPGVAERTAIIMAIAALFAAGWGGVAVWVRSRQRSTSKPQPPKWITVPLLCVEVLYLSVILFGIFI